jgi:chromosomal replication initiator protein
MIEVKGKQQTWQAILGEIELQVSRGNFMTWFKNTTLIESSPDSVIIGVSNVFVKQQLETRYKQILEDALQRNGLSAATVGYKMMSTKDVSKNKPTDKTETTILEREPSAKNQPSRDFTQKSLGLNNRYTFDSFVVGSGNELAYAACMAVSEKPGTKYNPLFLYGGVGIGKTHLIQATGSAIVAKNPKAKVLYVPSEQFLQEFVTALRFKKVSDFTNLYRSADVLIVDDIQFIAGKEKVQEEFFHTFNTLYQANKQIIFSSDQPPSEIPALEDRLSSRFSQGMAIDMQIPELETRCAILQSKAASHGVELLSPVTEYIAGLYQSNIRELEGGLNQLLAFCEIRNLEPTLDIAHSVFGGRASRPKHINAKGVIDKCSKYFNIPVDELLGPKRDKDIVVPRQIAMYLLRQELKLSFPKIAQELGRKDHTTAIHSVEKIHSMFSYDMAIKSAVREIKDLLYV